MATEPTIAASEQENTKPPEHESKGEKLFDWLTYGGIGYFGTFFTTIALGYWAKYGKGAAMFAKASKALEKTGLSAEAAETATITTALMLGGNVTLIPIKMMENHKPEIVTKLNDMVGDKSGDLALNQEPKQTWGSLIKARLVAWGVVFGSFMGAAALMGNEKFAHFEKKFAEKIVCKPLGKPTHINGAETALFKAGRIAALDVFATAASATLLYVSSRIFAKKNAHWHIGFLSKKTSSPANDESIAPAAQESDDSPSDILKSRKIYADSITPKALSNSQKSYANFVETIHDKRVKQGTLMEIITP